MPSAGFATRACRFTLLLLALSFDARGAQAVPTFNRDIAPVLWAHCGSCHRPGALGPFSLLEYREVRPRARQIAEVTASGRMPPWLPDGGPHFVGERRLTGADVALIKAWVAGGALEGRRDDLRARPTWSDGWQLGTPDLVVQAPSAYTLPPGVGDVFRNLVIPVPLAAGRWVRGIEVNPGNPRVVHHAALAIDRTGASRAIDAHDGEAGFPGSMIAASSARSPDNRALGWTPGMTPSFEAAGMAWRLDPGSDVVLLLHLMPGTRAETIRPSVAFYFTDTPPTRTPVDFKLGSRSIDLPAGASEVVVEDRVALPVDAELLSIYPHAHYLATRMVVVATLPDGTSQTLLSIRDWDFRWQEQYRYADPLLLPRGTIVTMRYVYDNSASNRKNPSGGRTAARYGPLSSDEMGDLWLRLVPRSADDALALVRAYTEHELQKDLVRARERVEANPVDADARLALGVALLEAEQAEAARVQLVEGMRLAPDRALMHLNLGNALDDLGRLDEAIPEYERAIALDPRAADAHNNLGIALGAAGRLEDAIAEFREALHLQPGYADAQKNLDLALSLRR